MSETTGTPTAPAAPAPATPPPNGADTQATPDSGKFVRPGAGAGKGIDLETALGVMTGRVPRTDRAAGAEPPTPVARAPEPRSRPAPPPAAAAPAPAATAEPDPIANLLQHFGKEPQAAPPATGAQPAPVPPGAMMDVALTIEGAERRFNQADLTNYVAMGLDYTKKTQQLSEQQREFAATQAAVEALLPLVEAEARRQLQGLQADDGGYEDMVAELRPYVGDPVAYNERQLAWFERRKAVMSERSRFEEIARAADAERERQKAIRLRDSSARLEQMIPGWGDQKQRQALQQAAAQFAMSVGFTKEELNDLVDHRQVYVLMMAMVTHLNRAQTQTRRPVVPVVERGHAPPPPVPQHIAQLQERLNQTGSTRDGVALLTAQRRAAGTGRGLLSS